MFTFCFRSLFVVSLVHSPSQRHTFFTYYYHHYYCAFQSQQAEVFLVGWIKTNNQKWIV